MMPVRTRLGDLLKKNAFFLLCFSFVGVALAGTGDRDLMKRAIFSPLPETMPSEEDPITPEKVKLGKMLFYEPRISADGTVSCVRCHPISLYGADGLRKSIGNNCRVNPRNDPTIFNAAGQISAHWIGNRKSVEDQAKQSVIGPPSFGMPSYEAVEQRLREFPVYQALFKEAFHSGTYLGGQMYQKFGILEPYGKYTKSGPVDEGRFAVTKNEADKYVFKVPVLRNVEKTSPYFHDGSVERLAEAVWIMGKVQLGKDLTSDQTGAICAFLVSLTGKIPEDALIVPVLPSRE